MQRTGEQMGHFRNISVCFLASIREDTAPDALPASKVLIAGWASIPERLPWSNSLILLQFCCGQAVR